jgi:rhombotail lipoprotein
MRLFFIGQLLACILFQAMKNSIQTFVDTSVFDIKSRKMLFRAPGLNKITKRSTAIGIGIGIGIDSTLSKKSLLILNIGSI